MAPKRGHHFRTEAKTRKNIENRINESGEMVLAGDESLG
jgi:hypothetical protein